MSGRYAGTLILLWAWLAGFALGQIQSTQTQSTESQPTAPDSGDSGATSVNRSVPAPALSGIVGMETELGDPSDTNMPHIPSFLGGQGSQLVLTTEMERSNYLRGGINISEGYNDNALLTPVAQEGNNTFSVFPNIALAQSTPRMRWSLDYAAGLTVNQRLSSQNQGSQNLTFESIFRLSPHVSLHAAENFNLVAGIFGASTASEFQPGSGGSNNTLITPVTNQRWSQTVVEANYHFAPKDVVGASGSFSDLHYSEVVSSSTSAPVNLTNTQTTSGTAFWLHELFRNDWAGFSYRFQRITYDPNGETKVHTFAFANSVNVSKGFHISGFIGPEYSENQGLVATGSGAGQLSTVSGWSFAGGLEGGWQSAHTSVSAGYSKQVTTGLGVLGAVRLQNIHAAVRREIFPRWTIDALAAYGDNQALTLALATNATSINTGTFGVMLERSIVRSLGLQIGYFHDLQDQSGSANPAENFNADRNRFFVTLSYQWAKALGR